ncbi:MAG: hypothetical protein ABIP79_14010 [Chitinophagaceae bacterium]
MNVYDDEVITALKNKGAVTKLVKNERNKLIINTKGAYYYKDSSGKYQLLSGLLPRLRKTFYPENDIYNLLKRPKTYEPKIGKRRKLALARAGTPIQPKKKEKKVSKGKFYGRLRGTVVHQEVEDFIFLNQEAFRKKHPTIHVYTKKIMTFILETMGWRLLRSEFDIYEEALRIGTSVDIIAVTNEGKLVLMEVKCGFADYWDRYDGYMHGCLHKLTNSPHHQAQLQIITAALFIAKNHQIKLEDMLLYVLRVDDQGLHHHKVNNEYVQKKGAKIYRDLLLQL